MKPRPLLALLFASLLPAQEPDALEASVRKILDVYTIASDNHADPVDSTRLFYEGIIPGLLRRLDPHSVFLDPGQFDQLKRMQRSESKGFGSVVSILPGRVQVLQAIPGAPLAKAGISAGDEILAINNIALGPLTTEQLTQVLSQARQAPATVYVRKPGNARPIQFTLIPEEMQSSSVERAFLLQPGYGYLRVSSFDDKTAKDIQAGIEKLGGHRLAGLVLDLRNNPGGVVASAIDTASLFLNPGQTILSARGRRMNGEEKVPATAKPYRFRLAVLVNAKSASASEIVAGALQDHDRATILGEPTFGKGLVQNVLPISQSTGLALTMALYYTPSGRSIQKPLVDMQLEHVTSAPRQEYKTDAGRIVRGGGGIDPDQAVTPPPYKRLEMVLDASGAYAAFGTEYLRAERPAITPGWRLPKPLLDRFRSWLSQNNIQPGIAEWFASSDWIEHRLRQEIINLSLGVEEGDKVEAEREPWIVAALATLTSAPAP